MAKKKLLVIEPHSDDGVISAGGFLEKFRDKYDYYFTLVLASDLPLHHNKILTRSERLKEFQDYVDHFDGTWTCGSDKDSDLPLDKDSHLDVFPRHILVGLIEKEIDRIRPDVLLFTGPSFHHDHTAVYEAVIAATRPTARYSPSEMFVLENPTYVHATNPLTRFHPDTYIQLDENEISQKLDCFRNCFPSQIRSSNNYLSEEGIKSWARYRGIEARCNYAEAFQTYNRVL